jgi:oxygen-independent coproporphyrinogen-3 oxidase
MVPSLGGSKTLIMWSYHPELLDKPVPRYTSYPTAAEFSAEIGEADQRRGLEQVRPDED